MLWALLSRITAPVILSKAKNLIHPRQNIV